MKTNLLTTLVFVASLAIFSVPVFVSADQWYDTLPKGGEYVPLPEPGIDSAPKDFESINVPSDDVGEDSQSPAEDSSNNESNVGEPEGKPVGSSLMWWLVGIVALVVTALITAPLWMKKVLSKVRP